MTDVEMTDINLSNQTSGPEAWQALQTGAGFSLLTGHGVLRISGADQSAFLHGQLSSDIKGLGLRQWRQALMLNHKGHALAQLQVLRRAEDTVLITEAKSAERVKAQLEAHIIFDQVTIEPVVGWRSLSLQGPRAAEMLETAGLELPEVGHFTEAVNGETPLLLYANQRSELGGFDLHASEAGLTEVIASLKDLGAAAVSEALLSASRIAAGIPLAPFEAGEGVLPQEAGLEPYVSYRKGCYLGQEIMARIEARGQLRRELKRISLSTLPAPDERDITLAGKKVGRLGSVAEHPAQGLIALAVLRRDLSGAALEVGGAEAQVLAET